MSDILNRRKTHFVLWCPTEPANDPVLVIGRVRNGNPAVFEEIAKPTFTRATNAAGPIPGLWELPAAGLGLTAGQTYHYWFEVDNTAPGSSGRIRVCDPLAFAVDYRVLPDANAALAHPAAVIGWVGGELVARDPNGEAEAPVVAPFGGLAPNNHLVIYELPTAWTNATGGDEFERAVGTYRDARALLETGVRDRNLPGLEATRLTPPYLEQLGVNAVEMLPPADSIYSREWGYGTSHYLAPDYELGYPEGHLSPTAGQDLTRLVNACHASGVRVFLDVVLGFMKEEPYRYIDFPSFYLEDPSRHAGDPDAYNSRDGGGRHFRNAYGASCPRYVKRVTTYDPVSGEVKEISPAQQHMLTFLARWTRDFHIDGVRMDSVENVANWDFVQEFKKRTRDQFKARYTGQPAAAVDARVLVVGEELTMPKELITGGRLDGLWNEHFQKYARAALRGEGADGRDFGETLRRAVDCTRDGVFADGAQAVNYLTSHDVEGERKERLYTFLESSVPLAASEPLFDRAAIEVKVRADIRARDGVPDNDAWRRDDDEKVRRGADGVILHRARLRRVRLGFVCKLTAVGIPMILAGEEFGDQHDLFNSRGWVTHEGGKQVDPVNYRRFEEPERREVFEYVARLVKLRTSHPALGVNDTDFFHHDFHDGKRVVAWRRGPASDPVVVVANFSDYTTPNALSPGAEYVTPKWPATPAGSHWFEVTRGRDVKTGRHDREPVFAWEAKVYRLEPGPGP